MKKIFSVCVFVIIFLVSIDSVTAIDSNKGLYVSPPFTDMEIGSGDIQKYFDLELKNNGAGTLMVNLSVVDFGTLDESGGVAFLTTSKEPGDRKYALASWVSLEKDWVIIEPGKTEKVKITILNKQSLSAGGHYGAVVATIKTESKVSKDYVGLNQSLASLIYIQKTGGEKKSLVINKIDFESNFLRFPNLIKLRFENNGNVHLVPRGKIEVKNRWGEIVVKATINEASAVIMPESFRVFITKPGQISRWVWPGLYTIETSFRYDGKTNFAVLKTDYYYFGREGVILYTIGFLAIGFGLYWKRRV